MAITYQEYYIHYQSSNDGFSGHHLSKVLLNMEKTDHKQQLIVMQLKHKDKTNLIGFITSCFSNPDNRDKISKYTGLGFYLTNKNKKLPSAIINFDTKTIHPLISEQHCMGYDPNKLLLCIGKCDIILSDGNLSNLCYFPVSYEADFDGIVNTHE